MNKDKELINNVNKILREMGFSASVKRTRGRSTCLPLFVTDDGSYYKTKKALLISNKNFKHRTKLDCQYILDEYTKNGWLPLIEDMNKDEIIKYCEKHSL